MPQVLSRLKSANAHPLRHCNFLRRRPWRKGRARAHGLADHHYNHSEVLLHLQSPDLLLHYHFTTPNKARLSLLNLHMLLGLPVTFGPVNPPDQGAKEATASAAS